MRERVDVVMSVGLPVALDVLDHLAPDAGVALDGKIHLLQIDGGYLANVLELENLELEDVVVGFAIVRDANAESGVDEAEARKMLLRGGHLPLERFEVVGRRKAYSHCQQFTLRMVNISRARTRLPSLAHVRIERTFIAS